MLSHIDKNGKALMVDVSDKNITFRKAIAKGEIYVGDKVLQLIMENNIKKGDVLATAKIAGILGAKKVGELIPLCHPLNLTYVNLEFQFDMLNGKIIIFSETSVNAPTGVEMEALTAVNIAALTIYDMCKGVDKSIVLNESCLLLKTGGKSGLFRNKEKISGYLKDDVVIVKHKETTVEFVGIIPSLLNSSDKIKCGEYELKVASAGEIITVLSDSDIKIGKGANVCLK